MNESGGIKYACDCCGQLIEAGRPRYILRGELFCAYDGGTIDESASAKPKDFASEMKRLIELAEHRSEKELQDEVHYAFEIDLCQSCRDMMYQQVKLTET